MTNYVAPKGATYLSPHHTPLSPSAFLRAISDLDGFPAATPKCFFVVVVVANYSRESIASRFGLISMNTTYIVLLKLY